MVVRITPIKTRRINPPQDEIWDVLDKIVPKLKDSVMVAIASKIISIHEGRTLPISKYPDRNELIKKEADYWLPRTNVNGARRLYTITQNTFVGSGGIDQSNAKNHWILYPKNPFESAKTIRNYLMKRAGIKNLGILITDSHSLPLRRGTMGVSIAYWGFQPLRRYVGTKDLYGYKFRFTEMNVADNLAAATVLTMGEGKEQTPIAIVSDMGRAVEFTNVDPYKSGHFLSLEEDLFGPLLKKMGWRKSGHK